MSLFNGVQAIETLTVIVVTIEKLTSLGVTAFMLLFGLKTFASSCWSTHDVKCTHISKAEC